MKLTHVRVTKYKCILDSEKFSLARLTCLVGKNEAGKTALLEALEKINSAQPSRNQFESELDYPRMEVDQVPDDKREETAVVRTTWSLETDEVTHINGLAGAEILSSN